MKKWILLACLLALMAGPSQAKEPELVASTDEQLKQQLNVALGRVMVAWYSPEELAKIVEGKAPNPFKYVLAQGSTANAFVDNDLLVVFEGAMSLPDPQLYFLLSHEFVHAVKKHQQSVNKQRTLLGILGVGISIFTRHSTAEETKSNQQAVQSLDNLAHGQYKQAHEQEADRQAARLLSLMGFDPVSALTYFTAVSPNSEEKDVYGAHPTFKARTSDVAKILPEVDFDAPALKQRQIVWAPQAKSIAKNGSPQDLFQGGQFDQETSEMLYRYLESSASGLVFDPVATQGLAAQVSQPLHDTGDPNYRLTVRTYLPQASLSSIESDIMAEVASSIDAAQGYRSYGVGASRDQWGKRQVALLLLR